MFLERFRNVVQPILIRNPQFFSEKLKIPPLFSKGTQQGGEFSHFLVQNPKIFAPSARFYYLFYYYFGLFTMFLVSEMIVLALVFFFFRACGALFLFQTFCACVESAIAACKFEKCLCSSRFMNNIKIMYF